MAVRSPILDMFSTHTEPTAWNVPPLWSDTAENHSWSFARTTLFLPSQLERRNTQALSNTALSNFNWKYWNKSSNRHCRANQWLYRHSAPRDRGETEATGEGGGWRVENRATEQGWDAGRTKAGLERVTGWPMSGTGTRTSTSGPEEVNSHLRSSL